MASEWLGTDLAHVPPAVSELGVPLPESPPKARWRSRRDGPAPRGWGWGLGWKLWMGELHWQGAGRGGELGSVSFLEQCRQLGSPGAPSQGHHLWAEAQRVTGQGMLGKGPSVTPGGLAGRSMATRGML